MQWSEGCAKIAAALAAAQGKLEDPAKVAAAGGGERGKRWKYAPLAEFMADVRKVLAEQQIALVESVTLEPPQLDLALLHSSGEWIRASYPLVGNDAIKRDPQTLGSAVTYARRYGIKALLSLAEEDDDGQAAVPTPQVGQTAQVVQVPPQQAPPASEFDEKGHHVSFERDKGRFFAELSKMHMNYEQVNDFITWLRTSKNIGTGTRISAMTTEQRSKTLAFLKSKQGAEAYAEYLTHNPIEVREAD